MIGIFSRLGPTLRCQLKRNWSTCKLCLSGKAKICVDKENPLVDEQLGLSIVGLKPSQLVTLRTTATTGKSNVTTFQSFAYYEADSNGCVDVARHVCLGGSYKGIDSMGLFWSMVPLKNQGITETRIIPRNVAMPFKHKIEVYDSIVDFNLETLAQVNSLLEAINPLDEKLINRWYFAKEKVTKETVKTGRIRGELYIPKGPGKFKGVIDLFGSGGGLMSFRAALLASHGFVTYALPYFNHDDLPNNTSCVDLDYFEEAVQWLLQHPKVDSDGIGIVATSLGVQFALLLATRRKNKIKATVAINGPDNIILNPVWVDGKPLDFFPFQSENIMHKDGNIVCRFCSSERLEDGDERCKQLPIEKIKGKLLVLASGDDQSFAPDFVARRMQKRMTRHGKGENIRLRIYPKAGHLLEPPYAPHCSYSFHKAFGVIIAWGGEAESHIKAEVDAWGETLNFLRNI